MKQVAYFHPLLRAIHWLMAGGGDYCDAVYRRCDGLYGIFTAQPAGDDP